MCHVVVPQSHNVYLINMEIKLYLVFGKEKKTRNFVGSEIATTTSIFL